MQSILSLAENIVCFNRIVHYFHKAIKLSSKALQLEKYIYLCRAKSNGTS